MEINKDQAKLFLELLETVQAILEESNILRQKFGNIQVGVFDMYVLKQKLKEFIGEENAN